MIVEEGSEEGNGQWIIEVLAFLGLLCQGRLISSFWRAWSISGLIGGGVYNLTSCELSCWSWTEVT